MNELVMKGKVAIVTGGGSGIGRGIAFEMAKAGAEVTVLGRRDAPLQETLTLLTAQGFQAHSKILDVCDSGAVEAAFAKIAAGCSRIDVLVNNAGIGGPNACGVDGPDRWDPILRTNLDGIYFCSREALKFMPEAGRIINISSVLGQFGVPGYTAYCASKHGVIGFTKALALEVAARKITVNAVCPGWVETQMARDGMQSMAEAMGTSYEAARKIALDQVPIGRILEPEEIGQSCVFLASSAASGITAQAINICGGQVMSG